MSVGFTEEPPEDLRDERVDFGWIGQSWRLFQESLGTWLLAMLIFLIGPTVVTFVLSIPIYFAAFSQALSASAGSTAPPPGPSSGMIAYTYLIVLPISTLVIYYLLSGCLKMALKQVRGEVIMVGDVFSGWPILGRVTGFSLIISLVCSLLVWLPFLPVYSRFDVQTLTFRSGIPTIVYWIGTGVLALILWTLMQIVVGLFLPAYALLADGEGVFATIRRSVRTMAHDWFRAACFVTVLGLGIVVSMLPCYLGLFVTVPMALLCCALAARDLIGLRRRPDPIRAPLPEPEADVWPPPPTRTDWPNTPQFGRLPEQADSEPLSPPQNAPD